MVNDAELWGQVIGWALLVGGAIVAFTIAVLIEDAWRVFKQIAVFESVAMYWRNKRMRMIKRGKR